MEYTPRRKDKMEREPECFRLDAFPEVPDPDHPLTFGETNNPCKGLRPPFQSAQATAVAELAEARALAARAAAEARQARAATEAEVARQLAARKWNLQDEEEERRTGAATEQHAKARSV